MKISHIVFVLFTCLSVVSYGESFSSWKKSFQKQAIKEGVRPEFMETVWPNVEELSKVVKSDRRQSEQVLDIYKYTSRVLTKKRIQDGKKLYREHGALLNRIYKKYNIAPQYLLALWGAETSYGTYKGSTNTLNALATLAYDKRRRDFFSKELIAFLKILDENKLEDVQGSWAGAFGNFQFMPRTFQAYGVDEDGDGRKDILHSIEDSFGSAANYLHKMGWTDHMRWGRQVVLSKYLTKEKRLGKKTVKEWAALGVIPADGTSWGQSGLIVPAELKLPMGVMGPAFLAYPNFNVLMKWNKSTLYAITIGLLADQIAEHGTGLIPFKKRKGLTSYEIACVQETLLDAGYSIGKVDGVLGKKTAEALQNFALQKELPQGCISKEFMKDFHQLKF